MESIKMNFGKIRWDGVDWIGVAQDMNKWGALLDSELNLRVA
jgi:hypothetical protein